MTTTTNKALDYKRLANDALKLLKRDRDREIIAKRFGLGLSKRYTLERIGQSFDITRERVRQIEKAATLKLKGIATNTIQVATTAITESVANLGGLALISEVAADLGVTKQDDFAYIIFLAQLSPSLEVIEDSDYSYPAIGLLPDITTKMVRRWSTALVEVVTTLGKPCSINKIMANLEDPPSKELVLQSAKISKMLSTLDGKWGLPSWPEVNPKSIRDKTFIVLNRHKKPLHFSEIAEHIHNTGLGKRKVTTQAVHNELIKDKRFVLIGRGIYALADWGYAPGTVADIIVEVLKNELPLHKDEIVRRVLERRQVKVTTIILNLQEKNQFQRVAKATYTLAK